MGKVGAVFGFGVVMVVGSAVLIYGPGGILSQKTVVKTGPVPVTVNQQSDPTDSTTESPNPSTEPSPDQAYEWVNSQVNPYSTYYASYRRSSNATTATVVTTTSTSVTNTDTESEPTPPPAPVYYDVTRTGAYKYTPAEVEAGVTATNPSYFTRTGNNFYTTLKSGTYGGGFPAAPGDYFYLNELYYQININSSLTYLNIGTHLKYKDQDINFYVDGSLAIKLVLVEDLSNPGVDFYVTKQYNLPPEYLWNTGTYGQVQGGPYIFDPVDIALPVSCSGC
ncbi:hypothetical protein EPO04_01260 [Patescibacteria group bacterium]|nr:MAG: hypothetical protein EPO04_01260 [Patescibacteria group bacterium]